MSEIREEIIKAQVTFGLKSLAVKESLDGIRLLHKMGYEQDAIAFQEQLDVINAVDNIDALAVLQGQIDAMIDDIKQRSKEKNNLFPRKDNMSIYAIGDLHLSSNEQKPMDIFGWINHKEKIFSSWNELVTDEDIVIIAGDTSWALKFEDAKLDLDEISRLRGRKIIIKGNHDYWWQSLTKMKNYPDIEFLHNNHVIINNYIFYGTRGLDMPKRHKIHA